MEVVEQDEKRGTLRCASEESIDRLEKSEALAFWVDHCPTVELG
jgi:hypothetical protein